MSVSHTPKGYHTATPYLVIKGAAAAIEFYKKVFSATEVMRMPGPEGMVMHAEIKIGDSMIMLADEFPDMGFRGPQALGGSPVGICLYFPDVDARFALSLKSG
ncbi:MAG TPA: VOC family protein, partial [Fimbriiglobus sp.]|nr:VOC family protein [Fimbriiglobus sp.]